MGEAVVNSLAAQGEGRDFRGNDLSQPGKEPSRLFPLRMTPFELCMLLEDSPVYPMQFFLRLRFAGRFERGAFTQAFDTALARHPLLMAVVQRGKRQDCCWVLGENVRPEIRWRIGPLDEGLSTATLIDIYREPGVRATVAESGEQTHVTLQFQHTACDGLGASDFAGDLLTAYANLLTTGAPYRSKRIDAVRLTTRATYPTRWQLAQWMARLCSNYGGCGGFTNGDQSGSSPQ